MTTFMRYTTEQVVSLAQLPLTTLYLGATSSPTLTETTTTGVDTSPPGRSTNDSTGNWKLISGEGLECCAGLQGQQFVYVVVVKVISCICVYTYTYMCVFFVVVKYTF